VVRRHRLDHLWIAAQDRRHGDHRRKRPPDSGAGRTRPLAAFVSLRHAYALDVLAEGGTYDLVFADAPDGKWHGLDRTIAALGRHGMLIVDDMTPLPDWDDRQRTEQGRVRQALLTAPQLVSVGLAHGSGVILSPPA
jgi:predicted O-methyltransferase YrrM